MKRGICFLLLGALSFGLVSCGGSATKEGGEELILKIFPNGYSTEAGLAHDITFKVTHNKAIECSLRDGQWLHIAKQEANADKGETTVTLHLDTNDGQATREDVLKVVSGGKAISASVKQLAIGEIVSDKAVTLSGVEPFTVTVKKQRKAWTAAIIDGDWLEVTPDSGSGMLDAPVVIKAKGLNIGSETRSCVVRITMDELVVDVAVTQPSDLLSGAFQEKVYGLYNVDGAGGNVTYDRYAHQINTLSGSVRKFRLLDPSGARFLELSELPSVWTAGSRVDVQVSQNFTSKLKSLFTATVTVVKEEDGFVWLLTDNKVGAVIKKVE